MRAFFGGHKFLINYVLWVVLGIILYVLGLIAPHSSSFFFFAVTLYLITLPGYLIWRIIRIQAQGIMRLLIFFGLGLTFYLIINLVAIFIGTDLATLINIYKIALPLLFIGAITFDFLKPSQETPICRWRDIWSRENIVYLVPIALSIFIFLVIEAKGADFNGDPYYHLAIVRKVVEGSKLNPASLVFSQTGSANPAYAYPAWHIFVAGISKIVNMDIFTTWSKLTLPILIFVFLAWWQLSKAIFQKKSYATIGFIFFATFTFFGNAGYLFQRLTVPDTFAQYLLTPLAFIFLFMYLFRTQLKKEEDYKWLILYVLSLMALLIVHGIHYFYVVYAVLLFSILYFIIKPKEYRRTLIALGTTFAPLILIGGFLEIKNNFISETFRHFNGSQNAVITYSKFSDMGLRAQYSFLLAPFLILFVKRYPRLIFLLVLMVLTPIVYWTPLKDLSSRLFSFVFTDRLFANVTLYYFISAFFVGLGIAFLSETATTLSKKWRQIVIGLLIAILGIMIIEEAFFQAISSSFFNLFYNDYISTFVSHYAYLIFIFSFVIILIILFYQRKTGRFFIVKDTTTGLVELLMLIIVSLFLISPNFAGGWFLIGHTSSQEKTNYIYKVISYETIGQIEPINFIKEKIPAKSIILSDQESSKELSMLTDNFMAYQLSSGAEQQLMTIFEDQGATAGEKTKLLQSPVYNIDYIYLRPAYSGDARFFDSYPNVLEKVFDGEAKIYKVNR